MNTYQPETPRAASAMVAAVLSAITLGVFVVMPVQLDSGFDREYRLAADSACVCGSAIAAPESSPRGRYFSSGNAIAIS